MKFQAFFAALREAGRPFGSSFSQQQVEGCEAIIKEAQRRRFPTTHLAYCLGTAALETAYTMQPITEYGGRRYFDKYDTGRLAKILGNTPEADGDGLKYRGRGYVQLTGLANYRRATKKIGADFERDPDKVLDPKLAAEIMFEGMSEGWFTGKKLGDYLTGAKSDWRNARRIVNGLDRAGEIADYAKVFHGALLEAGYDPAKPPALHVEAPERPAERQPAGPGAKGLWAALAALVAALFAYLTGLFGG